MPRDLPLSNGSLYLAFDARHRLRDLYFPHVGMENHLIGHACRLGVWVDGSFSWAGDEGWSVEGRYAKDSLVSEVRLVRAADGVELVLREAVDFHLDAFVRQVRVIDRRGAPRAVRLFFTHDFHISGNEVGDTAYFDPSTRGVVHYKAKRWFLANLDGGAEHFATGRKGFQGAEGTWRDCEDGELGGNPIAQGSVDSALGIHVAVPASGEAVCHYWLAAGRSYEEVKRIHRAVLEKSPGEIVRRTENYWRLWVRTPDFSREGLPDAVVDLFYRSLLIVRAQIDHAGGVVAANDSDIVQFGKDTYSYVWPRDGALVIAALADNRYTHLSRRFFEFCASVIEPGGFFLHKYNLDGSLASSWHPWYRDGHRELPIQEDETALVLWALRQYFQRSRQVESIKPLFRPLIVAVADFLVKHRDPATGLPLPSHDLWEERHAVHTFTVATVVGALRAAAAFCADLGEEGLATQYGTAAAGYQAALLTHLWDPEKGRFARSATLEAGGARRDTTIDASLYALFHFHALPVDDARVAATMGAVRDRLWVKTEVGGLARYENDTYHQVSKDVANVAGNPWFISTLWLAQYEIARAKDLGELESRALPLLAWATGRALPSGVLAEQVNPYTGEPLSVSPLTWSHAEFVAAVTKYTERRAALRR